MIVSDLRRVLYISRRAVGVSDHDIMDEIVLPAIVKNRRLGITGCIWYDAERFAQVIEGSAESIGSLLDTIREDPRHLNVITVLDEHVTERRFTRFRLKTGPEFPLPGLSALFSSCGERVLVHGHMHEDDVRQAADIVQLLADYNK